MPHPPTALTRLSRAYTQRPQALLFISISYALWAAVSLRWLTEFVENDHPLTAVVAAVLLLFGLLMGLEPLLTGDSTKRAHLYLLVQLSLVMGAMLTFYELDFFAILLLPLAGQAAFLFPRPTAVRWVGLFMLANGLGQLHQFGWPDALSFLFLYTAAILFVAAFVRMVRQAEAARQRSERLLAELQDAHTQLQAYADQAEELAIANERTRLARDLHDAVAQTLYGLTLQAEVASRKLTAGELTAVQQELKTIQADARQTLQEARLLIFELRPPILASDGLAAALRARLDAVEARSGLTMDVNLQETSGLSAQVETGLYRIAQEALHNVARHASATHLRVCLRQGAERVILEIADDGIGFNTAAVPSGRVGLRGMAERVAQMNGRFTLHSAALEGTAVYVEVPL